MAMPKEIGFDTIVAQATGLVAADVCQGLEQYTVVGKFADDGFKGS